MSFYESRRMRSTVEKSIATTSESFVPLARKRRSSQRQVDVMKTVQCGGKAKAKRPIYVKHKRQHRMINRALRSR